MNNMPPALRRELSEDPYYRTCSRANGDCEGRITWEHALTYAGRQIQAKFAIIPLCEWHHSVNRFQDAGGLNKPINVEIAMGRATAIDKTKYPLLPWK
jgi:hypothetical protein